MHGFDDVPAPPSNAPAGTPWYAELTRYHWFVLTVAALGWLFDTMDQQLFTLARKPAMRELVVTSVMSPVEASRAVDKYAGYATAIFLLGWATGGLAFGILGDRWGRAKVMLWTILIYSLCTGLSALSTGFWDFAFYRFITGLGVGGEFAVGVSLVAEVMPTRARPFALGLLQGLSAVGNIGAALISMSLEGLESHGAFENWSVGGIVVHAWRVMFVIGTVPALLAVLIRRKLKEPERWQAAATARGSNQVLTKQLGSYSQLFGHPVWRRNALVGLTMAFAGVVGLWGVGFFMVDLLRTVFEERFKADGLSGPEIKAKLSVWIPLVSVMQNLGGALGVYAYSHVTHYLGRKPTFAIAFVLATLSTSLVFAFISQPSDIFWMVPIMGFCQLALFGGYAIYFPELFPTSLRSTGTSFCYNVGRFVAAIGPFGLGVLASQVFDNDPLRKACVSMSFIFLIGLIAIPFAPETKDRPLPD